MKKIIRFSLIAIALVLAVYLFLPDPIVPGVPQGSLVSNEPADTESKYRTAFFTSLSRSDLIDYYQQHFSSSIKLNHPPEDAYSTIRDQTRSSWLEELINPGKNSLYINGFYPTRPTDQLNFNGVHYAAKITIKYVPSTLPQRFTILILAGIASYWLFKEYGLA